MNSLMTVIRQTPMQTRGEEFVPAGDNFSADSDSDNREVTAAADDDPVPMDKPVADVRPTAATLPFPLYNDMDIDEALWMFKWSKDLNNFPLAAPFTGDSGLKLLIKQICCICL